MTNEDALHRCVTEFMLDTCLCTKLTEHALKACVYRSLNSTMSCTGKDFLSSGSSAEFYIKPLVSCVGDVDIMECSVECLALPTGYTLPTELPVRFLRVVMVCEIIDSHQPGFVYLKPCYVLERNDNGCVTSAVKIDDSEDAPEFLTRPNTQNQASADIINQKKFAPYIQHFSNLFLNSSSMFSPEMSVADNHGPTLEIVHGTNIMGIILSDHIDQVYSRRCLVWPPQAAEWLTRSRSYGVPDERTINAVVDNGCDLVAAVHPHCRQDEWMSKYQWRLSFSRAEVTLLNNWTPVQQIVYHMLRFVIKRNVFSKTNDEDPDFPKLCNYHVKTLMLWECEQKPQSWWFAESSLIKLCSSLLHKLSDWVASQHCQQYFIKNCNLLDHFVEAASVKVCYRLRYLADSSFLVMWFVENYICKCVPDDVSALFYDIMSRNALRRAIEAVDVWKVGTLPKELCGEYFGYELMMLCTLRTFSPPFIKTLIRVLENVDQGISDFFTAVVSLHVAYKIEIYSLSEDLLKLLLVAYDPLPAAFSDTEVTAINSRESGGLLCISKAIRLATLSSVRSNALEMLHNEMSKAYLHHSFAYGQESTYSVVHVLLAALYYKSGHYQAATDHCKQVLIECAGEQFGPRCIGAEYLPQIDDNVDAVLGMILLYQHVQQNALNSDKTLQPHAACLYVFTTKLLAHYLLTVCSAVVTTDVDTIQESKEQLLQTNSPLLADILLFKSVGTRLDKCTEPESPVVEGRTGNAANSTSSSMDTTLLVTTLELVTLEKLITVQQMMIRKLQFPVVNEYEALYAYKCGHFKECLQLCRTNVDLLLCRDVGQVCWMQFPELLSLLDGELVSAIGIIRLMHPDSLRQKEYLVHLAITVKTFLVYLMVCCHKNGCNDSVGGTVNLIRYLHNEVFLRGKIFFFNRLILKLMYRSLKLYIKTWSDLHIPLL